MLAGFGAIPMKNALANTMSTLPEHLVRSLTWDRGKEMSAHAQFRVETGIPVFADPQSPWQRARNENSNGSQREYFPKGTELSRWPIEGGTEAVAHALESRPRKALDWRTQGHAFNEQRLLLHQPGVAFTG